MTLTSLPVRGHRIIRAPEGLGEVIVPSMISAPFCKASSPKVLKKSLTKAETDISVDEFEEKV